ncbi:MAG: RNA polymerase sigma factor [Pseudohongiellaceae bacterium]
MTNSKILQFERPDKESGRALKADRTLAQRAANGDRDAFQTIVEENKQRMFTVAQSVIRDAGVAEDIVQEAFIKAYRSLENFRGESKLSTWLHRITYLTAIDFQRAQARHIKLAEPETSTETIDSSPYASSESAVDAKQLKHRLEGALTCLTDFEQSVFTLRHMQNFKLKEIAVVLDRSEGAIKNILFRAIRKLRDQLDDIANLHQENGN